MKELEADNQDLLTRNIKLKQRSTELLSVIRSLDPQR
jgi:hypothetical protein